MKNLLSAFAAVLLCVPAAAAPSLEGALAAAEQSFQCLPIQAAFQKGAKVKGAVPGKAVTTPAPKPVTPKASSYVRISGYVRFTGNAYVSHTPGYASVNMSGYANLCDSTGQVCSGYTNISTYANVFVNGNFVNDWLRPYVNVSFYKAGRYVGSGQISGSVPVSGWVNGNWVNLSGSGYLNGDVYVTE